MQFTSMHLVKVTKQNKNCHFVHFSVVLQGDPGPPGPPGFVVSFIIHLVISETELSGMKR